jgi:hypothetical protein
LDQESGSRVQERLSSGVLHAFYLGLTLRRNHIRTDQSYQIKGSLNE